MELLLVLRVVTLVLLALELGEAIAIALLFLLQGFEARGEAGEFGGDAIALLELVEPLA